MQRPGAMEDAESLKIIPIIVLPFKPARAMWESHLVSNLNRLGADLAV